MSIVQETALFASLGGPGELRLGAPAATIALKDAADAKHLPGEALGGIGDAPGSSGALHGGVTVPPSPGEP